MLHQCFLEIGRRILIFSYLLLVPQLANLVRPAGSGSGSLAMLDAGFAGLTGKKENRERRARTHTQ